MTNDHENWWEHGGPYDGTSCTHCGRQRVELATAPDGTERRVCEKCGWDQELNDYAAMYPTALASSTPSPLLAAPYPDEQQQPYSGPSDAGSTSPDRDR